MVGAPPASPGAPAPQAKMPAGLQPASAWGIGEVSPDASLVQRVEGKSRKTWRFSDLSRALLPTLMKKRAQLTATTLRGRPAPYKAALVARFEQEALPLLADDDGGDAAADGAPRLRVVVDRAFAGLAALQDAHEYMESNANAGKIVIELD